MSNIARQFGLMGSIVGTRPKKDGDCAQCAVLRAEVARLKMELARVAVAGAGASVNIAGPSTFTGNAVTPGGNATVTRSAAKQKAYRERKKLARQA